MGSGGDTDDNGKLSSDNAMMSGDNATAPGGLDHNDEDDEEQGADETDELVERLVDYVSDLALA